jgi:hypothetical protein
MAHGANSWREDSLEYGAKVSVNSPFVDLAALSAAALGGGPDSYAPYLFAARPLPK